ncbi:hypothetical protein IG631_06059 [Alternaria alternata]|nr:hypothetical protein IG631_06059 [Alternaria alternata]
MTLLASPTIAEGPMDRAAGTGTRRGHLLLLSAASISMLALQLGVSDREARDTTPLSCLVCPVPGDQHCIRKTKHAASPALCTQPFCSLSFLLLHSLSKLRLYIRLTGA